MQEEIKWKCRWSPTLGELESTAEEIWGTEEYEGDRDDPTVFFGLYGLPDFYTLWRHRGPKCILWAGTDIIHFINGYWLDNAGKIKIDPDALAKWIDEECDSFVENKVEQKALRDVGIISEIVPSFLGRVEDYKLEYTWRDKTKLYTSVSGNNFKQYGWDKIYKLAQDNPDIEFHLYGNTEPFPVPTLFSNIIQHGRIPKEQMNEEIKKMTGALRLTEFDGFSEIIAKSLLWGQWPVSLIQYPHTVALENIRMTRLFDRPNTEGREWLLSKVNKYPWVNK